jgi:hypothetical protein
MTDEAMSPLRRRMIEDMAIRKLAPKTQQEQEPDRAETLSLETAMARESAKPEIDALTASKPAPNSQPPPVRTFFGRAEGEEANDGQIRRPIRQAAASHGRRARSNRPR